MNSPESLSFAVEMSAASSKLSEHQRAEVQKLFTEFGKFFKSAQEIRNILSAWAGTEQLSPALCELLNITVAASEYDFNAKYVGYKYFDLPIDELYLTSRSVNCLKAENILYLGDLVSRSDSDLLKVPNLGRKSINEIKELLATRQLALEMDVGDWKPKQKTQT